ncbi:hypothetical protein [Pontibacter liquoris]|uniref:hypothetical protein n=1 Tax=Pontibacter liquoris TaxID=2905677 RepID=UPI001FA6FB51|nr:hypothetical protein [Pontibacter liquoris]
MKKVLYTIVASSAIFFATSCNTKEKGTSTEVASANDDENVDPDHIRGYGNNPSQTATGTEEGAPELYRKRAEIVAGQMASDLNLDQPTQNKVMQVLLTREQQIGQLGNTATANASGNMGGEPRNDTENDTATNKNTTSDPNRPNNKGDVYAGNAANKGANEQQGSGNVSNPTGTGSTQQPSAQNTENARKNIIAQTDKELKAILTPEQWTKYEKNRGKYKVAE